MRRSTICWRHAAGNTGLQPMRGWCGSIPRANLALGCSGEATPGTATPMFSVVPVAGEAAAARAVAVAREGRDGTIWAGTDNGLYRLVRSDRVVSLRYVEVGFPNDNREQRLVADVLQDAHGSLWIAAPSGLYRRWPDGRADRYTKGSGLPSEYLQGLLEDHDGRLWAATLVGGFFRFTPDDSRRPPVVDLAFTTPDLPTPWVFQLLETSSHRFWIATARGILEFFPAGDDRGRHFRAYSTRNGLSYFDVTALAEDAAGNLWLGTNNAGAMKFALNGFTAYGERDGLRQVSQMFNDRAGNLCFRGPLLGDQRSSVFEGGRLDLVSTAQPEYYQRIGCFDGQPLQWLPAWRHCAARLGLGQRRPHPTNASRRMVAGHRRRSVSLSRGGSLRRTADIASAVRSIRRTKDWRPRRCIGSSKTRAATCGFPPLAPPRMVWHAGIISARRVIDLAGLPGLPALKDTLPRAFGEDAAGHVVGGVRRQNRPVPRRHIRAVHVARGTFRPGTYEAFI